jgi:hypothetical protein
MQSNQIGSDDEQFENDYVSDAVDLLGTVVDEARKQRLRDMSFADLTRHLQTRLVQIERRVKHRQTVLESATLALCGLSILFGLVSSFTGNSVAQHAMGTFAALFALAPALYIGFDLYFAISKRQWAAGRHKRTHYLHIDPDDLEQGATSN